MNFVYMKNSTAESAAPPPAEELLKKIEELEIGHAHLKQEISRLLASSTAHQVTPAYRHQKQRSHSISPQRVPRPRADAGDGGVGGIWKKGTSTFRHSSPLQRESRNRELCSGGGGVGPPAVRFTEEQYLNILQSMGQSVHVLDVNNRIIYWLVR